MSGSVSNVKFALNIPSGASSAASSAKGGSAAQATASSAGAGKHANHGKPAKGGGVNQKLTQVTQAELDAKTAKAEAVAAEAKARKLKAEADAAEAEARIAKAKAGGAAAVVSAKPSKEPKAPKASTRQGDYVTRDEFDTFVKSTGAAFQLVINQGSQTQEMIAAIANGKFGSQIKSSSGCCLSDSLPRLPAPAPAPAPAHAHAHAPQSLEGLMRTIPENAGGFRGLCQHIQQNSKVAPFTIHKLYCAWQMSSANDDLACALMALTNGKPLSDQRLQPGIRTALEKPTNIRVFMNFFRMIADPADYRSYTLTFTSKGGQQQTVQYGLFSSDQAALNMYIHKHILA